MRHLRHCPETQETLGPQNGGRIAVQGRGVIDDDKEPGGRIYQAAGL